jgi:hypothetical protein
MTIPRNTFSGFVLIINEFGQESEAKKQPKQQLKTKDGAV